MIVSLVHLVGCEMASSFIHLPQLFFTISIPQIPREDDEDDSKGDGVQQGTETAYEGEVGHDGLKEEQQQQQMRGEGLKELEEQQMRGEGLKELEEQQMQGKRDGTCREWLRVYASEVLTDSFREWQPLGKTTIPLGLPRVRAQESFKIDVYECARGIDDIFDRYPMVHTFNGACEGSEMCERIEKRIQRGKLAGSWIVRRKDHQTHVERCMDDLYCGVRTLYVDFRDGRRVYLISPTQKSHVHVVDDVEVGNIGRRLVLQRVSLEDVRERVMRIHDAQRSWQHAYTVCMRRKALCMKQYNRDDGDRHCFQSDSTLDRLQHTQARYYMLQEQCVDSIHSMTLGEHARDGEGGQIVSSKDIAAKHKVRLQALLNALQALVLASKKVRSSKMALEGMDGQGKVDALREHVDARRAMMLSEIRAMYQVREVGDAHRGRSRGHDEPQVQDHMDARWSGIDSSSSMHGGSDTRAHHHAMYSIRHCRIHTSTWKYAFDKDGHQYDDPDADRETNIALGYVAHCIVKMSEYLDIPLRYPVIFRGSYSVIRDNYSAPTTATIGLKSTSNTNSDVRQGPREFPLYCESPKERPTYAIGVFLLNKDIVQILTYLSFVRDHTQQSVNISQSPNDIAHNLYTLLTFYDTHTGH